MNMTLNELIAIKKKSSFKNRNQSQRGFGRKRRINGRECNGTNPLNLADKLNTSNFIGFYSSYHKMGEANKSKTLTDPYYIRGHANELMMKRIRKYSNLEHGVNVGLSRHADNQLALGFPAISYRSKNYVDEPMTSAASEASNIQRNNMRNEFVLYKIELSYLNYGLTPTDLWKLFGEFGLKTVKIYYDGSGRSLGKADIVFYNEDSAFKAVRWYNNIYLNSSLMKKTWDTNSLKASDDDRVCIFLTVEKNVNILLDKTKQELCVNIHGNSNRRVTVNNTILSNKEENKQAQLSVSIKNNTFLDTNIHEEEDFEDVFRELDILVKS